MDADVEDLLAASEMLRTRSRVLEDEFLVERAHNAATRAHASRVVARAAAAVDRSEAVQRQLEALLREAQAAPQPWLGGRSHADPRPTT